ncbi:MAG: DUF1501 domain-containing protein [Chloroflexota bacterium]
MPTHSAFSTSLPFLTFTPSTLAASGDTLIVIFLRGAADMLNLIVPHSEDAYYQLRPILGIPRPDDSRARPDQRAIDLDGYFGLHPALRPLLPAWQARHLAVIHACGAQDESRSHFKSQELMERGVSDERGPASGWIGRHLATLHTTNLSPLRAIGLGEMPQRSLSGAAPVTAFRSIEDFRFGSDAHHANILQSALAALYTGEQPLATLGQETLGLLDALSMLGSPDEQPISDLPYPQGEFGLGLQQIAMLVKAGLGLEVAAIDLGGWDTHFAQGGVNGQMANLAAELGQGLAALHADLDSRLQRLTVVVMTEFGRRAYENGSLGTDHGHGAAMLVLGGNVLGGKVYTHWPGLTPNQLLPPGDLAVTIDYRHVLAEICLKRLHNPSLAQIFPEFTPNPLGLFQEI